MGRSIKVPVILQMEALECGAACLGMVLAYYNRFIPLEQLRLDCNVSRDGSSAKYIVLAARLHGMEAQGFRRSPSQLREEGKFPVILHWNFNHFVVLTGFHKGRAQICDPACGNMEIEATEFDRSFTGVAIEMQPGKDFKPYGKPKSVFRFVGKRIENMGSALVFVTILGIFLAFLALLKPVFYKLFVDDILIGLAPDWAGFLLTGMCAALALELLVLSLQKVFLNKMKLKLASNSACAYMWHVLRLPVAFFTQRFTGDISSRLHYNEEIAATLVIKVAPVLLNLIMMAVYFVLLLYYDTAMALVSLVLAALNLLLMLLVSSSGVNANRNMRRDEGRLSGARVSGVEMLETIKASGSELSFFGLLAGYQAKYANSKLEMERKSIYLRMLPNLLTQIISGVLLIMGVFNVLKGDFSIGALMAFQGFMSLFFEPVRELVNTSYEIMAMSGKAESIEDVMSYKPDVKINTGTKNMDFNAYEKLRGELELKNVTFKYSRLGEPIIRNFNLHIKKGGVTALVGGSGSGKSTIAKAVSGLYPISEGVILFDGKPKDEIDRDVFTASLALIDQNISMFADTVYNNITMWDSSVTSDEVISACKDACIHDDIAARKGGYEFTLSENGGNLSGGQKQRLEIARALAANPSIIIMDEATSALDTGTEKHIMDAIRRRGITCLIIAHRLATIRDADEIILLENGKATECGTHAELIALNGRYAALVKSE